MKGHKIRFTRRPTLDLITLALPPTLTLHPLPILPALGDVLVRRDALAPTGLIHGVSGGNDRLLFTGGWTPYLKKTMLNTKKKKKERLLPGRADTHLFIGGDNKTTG